MQKLLQDAFFWAHLQATKGAASAEQTQPENTANNSVQTNNLPKDFSRQLNLCHQVICSALRKPQSNEHVRQASFFDYYLQQQETNDEKQKLLLLSCLLHMPFVGEVP